MLGWDSSSDPCTNGLLELSTDLQSSDSGLYYNNVHPLLTIENLGSIAPNFQQTIDNTQVFDGVVSYNLNERVNFNGKLYSSLIWKLRKRT